MGLRTVDNQREFPNWIGGCRIWQLLHGRNTLFRNWSYLHTANSNWYQSWWWRGLGRRSIRRLSVLQHAHCAIRYAQTYGYLWGTYHFEKNAWKNAEFWLRFPVSGNQSIFRDVSNHYIIASISIHCIDFVKTVFFHSHWRSLSSRNDFIICTANVFSSICIYFILLCVEFCWVFVSRQRAQKIFFLSRKLEQISRWCRKEFTLTLLLHYCACWLVQNTRANFSGHSEMKLNQPLLTRVQFLGLQVSNLYLLRVSIG